ncbi:putative enzyme [uncultured Alphaproteobacteria bacterium]|uniref:Putative enzyme n=1 Tax=uncultured Alphaproteobacteria bacterium TaxID=91750 RepID=A0A212KLP2_9PROT|nr:putative enzyme [uncultured Alphaproteobacteria bacterium]
MAVKVTTLDNGLRVVSDEMPGMDTVSIGAWVGVGARSEPAHLNGVSHLLEHMAFKGTERRTARAIAEEIEAVGGHINAYTSRETTAYYAKVLKDDLPLAVDIVGDILQHSTLDPVELDRERQVVVQEIGQAIDTPDDIIFDWFQQTAYPDQAIGRPVLGTAEIVRGLSRETIFDFMRAGYTAPQIVVSAAGGLDHARFLDLVQETFGGISPQPSAAADARATYAGGHYREERDLEQTHLVLGFEGVSYQDDDYYALAVMSALFGGGMSSRLFQEVREQRGLAYSIYAYASSYVDTGMFTIYAGTSPEDIPEMVAVVADECAKLSSTLTEAEVARARAQLRASTIMGMESTSSRCEHRARQLMIFGEPLSAEDTIARIDAVDLDAVRRITERVLKSPITTAAVGPLDHLESDAALARRFAF